MVVPWAKPDHLNPNLQEVGHETVQSSNYLDRFSPKPFEKKIHNDHMKPSLSPFARNSMKGKSARSRRMKSFPFLTASPMATSPAPNGSVIPSYPAFSILFAITSSPNRQIQVIRP
jgi:hypothetical protein